MVLPPKELRRRNTPYLYMDKAKLVKNCRMYSTLFSGCHLFYSVKANSTLSVLSTIRDESFSFDVASWEEVKKLKSIGVKPSEIIFSAPTKLPRDVKQAFAFGINMYAFDSEEELKKIASIAPKSKVVARLAVDNDGSRWPLTKKFGLSNESAVKYIMQASQLGLVPAGITFHVGSQNLMPTTWGRAIDRVWSVWLELKKAGISLDFVNIGGGFPVEYTEKVPPVSSIAKEVMRYVKSLFGKELKIYVEPGRGVVGNVGTLCSSVINKEKRDGERWIYIDVGVFNGLQETLEGFKYRILTEDKGRTVRCVLCGPTCDSADTISKCEYLPENLKVGDKIYISATGAYTTSYEYYNGFKYPKTFLI